MMVHALLALVHAVLYQTRLVNDVVSLTFYGRVSILGDADCVKDKL